MAFQVAIVVLVFSARLDADLQKTLLRCLPAALVAGLALKIAFSSAVFFHGLRRNAITDGAISWIVGGWALGGIFLVAYTASICQALGKTTLWPLIAMTGFLLLPLADLAIAPLAMTWNRHR